MSAFKIRVDNLDGTSIGCARAEGCELHSTGKGTERGYIQRYPKYEFPGHRLICSYSAGCQPVTMLTLHLLANVSLQSIDFEFVYPKRPGAIESIVTAIRAQSAGGRVKIAADAKSLILEVTAAIPATEIKP